MKGFKHTGRGPKSGHSFSSKAGFTGSTGRTRSVRGYSQSVPAKTKFASGGVVKVADPGSSVVRRNRPVTEFDAQHGGKGPLRPGFAEGGKVGAAIKMVKQLIAQGNSTEAAAAKAARRYGVPQDSLKQGPTGGGGLPAGKQMLARGGSAVKALKTAPPAQLSTPVTGPATMTNHGFVPGPSGSRMGRPSPRYGSFGRSPRILR